ncbi:GGDEF domain-containing protein [Shewanella sp. YIC-542]|uniref:GGDEF domain-containing protein n=1 Tax=Shewanella mytili TaxID=3377111 RepID=UPI00398EFFFA
MLLQSCMASPEMWEDEFAYRRMLLRILLRVAIVLSLLLALLNLRHEPLTLAVLEVGIALCALIFLLRLPHTRHLSRWTSGMILIIGSVILFGIHSKELHTDGFYWLLMMPPTNMLLLGLRLGGIFTFIFGVLGVLFTVLAHPTHNGELDISLLTNATLSYLFLWGSSHIYERKRSQMVRQLREMAARDPLTGLHNRLHLERIFNQMVTKHQNDQASFTLLLLDIDHFKRVNDEHGHEAGDMLLRRLGQRMTYHTRHDDRIFRVGGEEFCILLPHTPKTQAMAQAERLRQDIQEQAPVFREQSLHITVSMGLAQWPLDGKSFDALYRQADLRLYEAKRNGRNQIVATALSPVHATSA